MAYNPVEELKQGNVSFLSKMINYDHDVNYLIQSIRGSKDIDEILKNSIHELYRDYPRFLFRIIYDNPNYETYAYLLFKDNYSIEEMNISEIFNMYNKTVYGKAVVQYFYNNILKMGEEYANTLISTFLMDEDENYEYLKEISLHKDLHIRYLFMNHLVKYYPNSITKYYDDITEYFTSYTHRDGEQMTFLPKLMEDEDISKLCVNMLLSNSPYYTKTKEFILENYPKNSLAWELLRNNTNSGLEAFKQDADKLYLSSKVNKIDLYKDYSKYISGELLEDLSRYMNIFRGDSMRLKRIYHQGLGDKLEELVDKYLSLSKNQKCQFLTSGSTSAAYKIGDYCFKLSRTKWSYDKDICPDLYLILKNLEEVFLRDDEGIVQAGIEVQPLLTRKMDDVPRYVYYEWLRELDRLGYEYLDRLESYNGYNVMLLDSYKDANTQEHDSLPNWFKEYPLVLVDRDMIFKKGEEYKLQRDHY